MNAKNCYLFFCIEIVFVIVFSSMLVFAQTTTPVQPSGKTYDFLSYNGDVFATTSEGIYKYSVDNQEWTLSKAGYCRNIVSDKQGNLYATMYSGIQFSNDGGISWSLIPTPPWRGGVSPVFITENSTMITNADYAMQYSSDLGATWKTIKPYSKSLNGFWGLKSFFKLSNNHILGVFRTWRQKTLSSISEILFNKKGLMAVKRMPQITKEIYANDWVLTEVGNGVVYAVQIVKTSKKFPFVVYKSNNYGKRWSRVQTTFNISIEIVDLASDQDGNLFLALEGTGIYVSSDGGKQWTKFRDDVWELKGLAKIWFSPEGDLFAGKGQSIYRLPASEVRNSMSQIKGNVSSREIPEENLLAQNFPNPFNPTTVINYQLSSESSVSLKVFNVLGQEVANLLNWVQQDAGEQSIEFDAANLPNGVYVYRIQAKPTAATGVEFIDTKRMLLMK